MDGRQPLRHTSEKTCPRTQTRRARLRLTGLVFAASALSCAMLVLWEADSAYRRAFLSGISTLSLFAFCSSAGYLLCWKSAYARKERLTLAFLIILLCSCVAFVLSLKAFEHPLVP